MWTAPVARSFCVYEEKEDDHVPRLSLIPRKNIFFTQFSQHAQNALEAAQALDRLFTDFTDVEQEFDGEAVLAVAAKVGTTRLIDNVRLQLGAAR